MNIINQKMEVKGFPPMEKGEEAFFGYVMGVGWLPDPSMDWRNLDNFVYADFYYNGKITRYRMPDDEDLILQLQKRAFDNIRELHCTDYSGYSTKIWIERLPDGQWNTFYHK